ncbi:MAG: hypothetical protein Q9204_008208, partial [Flavoplaca sp. TL-2023a]
PGDLVPICFEKSSAIIVAILGVLKAGAGYVPLDIDHPPSRIDHIIREIRARLVIMSPTQAASRSFPLPVLIPSAKTLSISQDRLKRRLAEPHDIAYVIFTSGTTGKPKDVVTEHGAARLSVLEHGKRYQHQRHGSNLRALHCSSYTFDASVLDIFATMAYGGCLCIPSEHDRTGDLEGFLIQKEINFADLAPTIANLQRPGRLPKLKVMAIGGKMASRSITTKWTSSQWPLEYFVNGYGPTEAAKECAVGEVREGLTTGYLNDIDLSQKAFIDSSHWLASIGETRFYKTGNIARIDVDGNVEIIGRKDDGQLKLHGLRLDLGEIEAAIRTSHLLAKVQNVCAAKLELNGKPIVAAFIQLSEGAPFLDSIFSRPSKTYPILTEHAEMMLRNILPAYMFPTLWLP